MDKQQTDKNSQKAVNELIQKSRSVHVTVKNKTGTIIDEEVKAVSSYNALGIFDVLPLHTHFISLIRKRVTIHQGKDGKDRDIDIGTGLMKVDDNKIDIYLGLPEADQSAKKT